MYRTDTPQPESALSGLNIKRPKLRIVKSHLSPSKATKWFQYQMEAHLLTASLLHCPKVQALVPQMSRDTILSILQCLCSPQEGVLVSKNSLQRASSLSRGQACLTRDPQLTGSGAWEDVPFNLFSVLWLCIQVTAQHHQSPRVMPQPCPASDVPTQP